MATLPNSNKIVGAAEPRTSPREAWASKPGRRPGSGAEGAATGAPPPLYGRRPYSPFTNPGGMGGFLQC